MSIITKVLVQDAVYWPPGSGDGFDEEGRRDLDDPVAVTCRWEDKQEEFIDAQGVRQVSRAVVMVSQDMDIGGALYLGTVADVEASGFPTNPLAAGGAYEIRGWRKTPNIKGTEFLREAIL